MLFLCVLSKPEMLALVTPFELFFSLPFFHICKIGEYSSVARDMNLLKATDLPVMLYISFILVGDCILMRAWILLGFALIPCWFIMNPRNFYFFI